MNLVLRLALANFRWHIGKLLAPLLRLAEHTSIKQTKKVSTGDVLLTVEPLERGDGFQFEDETDETQIPRQYVAFIEKALEGAMGTGPRIGYPMQDVKVTLTGGSYHPTDSSEVAF